MSLILPAETLNPLRAELDATLARLLEANEILDAIRNGEVDGLVMTGDTGRIFTLQGSQEPYRLLVERMSEGAFTLSREGDILYANEALALMLQLPLEQVIGSAFINYVIPADRPNFAELMATAWGGSSRGEIAIQSTEGVRLPLRLGINRVEFPPTVVLGVVATNLATELRSEELERRVGERTTELYEANRTLIREVAERQRAAQALSASELRYRRLFESAQDGILILDAETGMVVDVNPFLVTLLGFSHEQFLGKAIWELGFFKDIVANAEKFAELQAREYLRYENLPLKTCDGHGIEVEFVSNVYLVEGARVIQCNIRDVTARVEAERAVRESEERFRTMANSITQLAWIARADGAIYWYNERWYEYTGTTPEQMEGGNWQSVHDPEVLPKVLESWKGAIAAGKPWEMEFPLRGADGRYRTFLTRVRPLRDAEGAVVQWFGTNTDVEAMKQVEEQARRMNSELEQRVEARTAELLASNHELEAFSYSVSHDLRAPLRAIDGYSQVLVEDYNERLDEEGRHVLGVVRSEAQRMGRLIDELLNFSRVGRQAMQLRETDMRALAETAYEEAIALEPGRKISAMIDALPVAHGEPTMLRQVWANLLNNAVKYTRHRAAALIEVGATQENGETIYSVRDNGAGFDMAHAGKLFGVFQRLHGEAEFEGTGVGLAFVKRIIQRHGGRVWAESAVDQGATFYFALPAPAQPALTL